MHHSIPSALSSGKSSCSTSRSLIPLVRSSIGLDSITSFRFDINLWRQIPPLWHIVLLFSIRLH